MNYNLIMVFVTYVGFYAKTCKCGNLCVYVRGVRTNSK